MTPRPDDGRSTLATDKNHTTHRSLPEYEGDPRDIPATSASTGNGRTARSPAGPVSDGRSLPQLVRELSEEGMDLVRQEIALAKAEMQEKLEVYQRNAVSMAIGGALLLTALLFGLWAVNTGVTALLAQFISVEVAVWLSPLLLAVVLAAVGWGMVSKGKSAIKDEGVTPHRTTESLKQDKRWAKAKVREAKEEIKHG